MDSIKKFFNSFPQIFWWLIATSTIVRAFLAWWLELGNDEVYYWTYALFPDLSHFDHPPMVGIVIQIFSLNLLLKSELFLRLSSVVLMSANTILIYLIGKTLRNERTALIAALLYQASVYAFVITGIFILPDSPQNFFWLFGIYTFLGLLRFTPGQRAFARAWLLFGLLVGLAMLSKYTSAFLGLGALFFVLFQRPFWLRSAWPWIAATVAGVVFLPVILWNVQNHFISFSFHGARVTPDFGLRPDYFVRELAGQLLYNNPINTVLIWVAVWKVLNGKNRFVVTEMAKVLLWVALPPIVVFLVIGLFRATLPHWTGPAYVSLIPLAAAWLDSQHEAVRVPVVAKASVGLLLLVLLLGSLHIKFGLLAPQPNNQPYHRLGKDDPGLDMFGYRALLPVFTQLRQKHLLSGHIKNEGGLVGENWFPLANYDFYIAQPLGLKAYGIGTIDRLHKYVWINDIRGGLKLGADYWYITNSRDYKHPAEVFHPYFREIIAADTVTIYRRGVPAKRHFIFILRELSLLPPNEPTK